MDYALDSLEEAFQQAAWRRRHAGVEVFGILLATSLEREFLIEYLSRFHETHHLTGPELVILGPRLASELTITITMSAGARNIHTLGCAIRNHGFNPEAWHGELDKWTRQHFTATDIAIELIDFLARQTAASYSFARFAGVPLSRLPCMLFYNNLDNAQTYFLRPLRNIGCVEFLRELRNVCDELRERCGWSKRHRERQLAAELHSVLNTPPTSSSVRRAIYLGDRVARFLTAVSNIARTRGEGSLDDVQREIEQLANGVVSEGSLERLRQHRSTNQTWLPREYRAALSGISLRSDEGMAVLVSLPPAQDGTYLMDATMEDRVAKLRMERAVGIECELAEIRASRTQYQRPSDVLRELYRNREVVASRPIEQYFDSMPRYQTDQTAESLRSVFISYRNDSESTRMLVGDLAHDLVRHGFDVRLDQFEADPSEGFLLWMTTQINLAGAIVCVCTEGYLDAFLGRSTIDDTGTYSGLGVRFEARLIREELYFGPLDRRRLVLVDFPEHTGTATLPGMKDYRLYHLPGEFHALIRRLEDMVGARGGMDTSGQPPSS